MDELRKQFRIADGRTVIITVSDYGDIIEVSTPEGMLVGKIELSLLDPGNEEAYLLVWMYMDRLDTSYKRQGIGRAALQFHKECFDTAIVARDHDGHTRDDGAHLTGDAPSFVQAMMKEGIISPFHQSGFDDPY